MRLPERRANKTQEKEGTQMNIGIRLHDTAPGTLKERLAFAKAQGFSCAHVALSKVLPDFSMQDAPKRLTEDFAASVRRDFADTGMDCAVLGCYLNLADPNQEQREKTREIYCAHLRFAAMMGARVVGTETNANPASHFGEAAATSEEAFRLFVDALRPVVRCAEEAGAVMAVEPVYHHIISTPERAQRMLEALPSDHLQIILDAVNLIGPDTVHQADAIIHDAIRRLGNKVTVLHMKDFVLQPDGKMSACACGLGSMRYDALLSFARARNLPMTLENTTPHNAAQARRHLEQLADHV